MLAALLNFGLDDEHRLLFSVHNMESHRRIAVALASQYGVNFPLFPLDPMPAENQGPWLEQHQELHNVFSQILGLQSNNFNVSGFKSSEEVEAFAQQHFQNHFDAHQALRIT